MAACCFSEGLLSCCWYCQLYCQPAVGTVRCATHMHDSSLLPTWLPTLQALNDAIGDSPGTRPASGQPLHFPNLAYFETHPAHPAVRAAALAWGKATMLCCWMGHLTPWRPEWFANFCHPDHWPEVCPHGGCNIPDCKGNGVRRSGDGREYILVASHHKHSDNSKVRDKAPIIYPLPPSMFLWMDVWSKYCWPLLAAEVGAGGRAGGGDACMDGSAGSCCPLLLCCCPF